MPSPPSSLPAHHPPPAPSKSQSSGPSSSATSSIFDLPIARASTTSTYSLSSPLSRPSTTACISISLPPSDHVVRTPVEDPAAAAAAATAATSSRLGGLGVGTTLRGGSAVGAGVGGVPGAVRPGVQSLESLKEVFALRLGAVDLFVVFALLLATAAFIAWRTVRFLTTEKAVMRSQNRSRKKSRLDQAILPSVSPPIPDEAPPKNKPESPPAPVVGPLSPTRLMRPESKAASSTGSSTASNPSGSYPFPTMRSISSTTIAAAFNSPGTGPFDKIIPSGAPTPASVGFMPPGQQPPSAYENPDFPTPNMYELALLLHSEPGIEAFWSNVVKIATTCYKAERVTMAVPSDSTDLENTPWGQKASFNMAEDDRLSLTYMGDDRGRVGDQDGSCSEDEDNQGVPISWENPESPQTSRGRSKRGRSSGMKFGDLDPESVEPMTIDNNLEGPFSPVTILPPDPHMHETSSNSDWVSVDSGISPSETPQHGSPELKPEDPDKAYRRDESEMKGTVFPTLLPLGYEADSLLDGTGVSRVLQRGKTVILSREYRNVKTHLEAQEKRRKDEKSGTASQKPSPSKVGSKSGAKIMTPGPSTTIGLGTIDLPTSPFKMPSQPPTPLAFVAKAARRRRVDMKDKYAHNPVLQYYSTQQHLHHVQSRTHSPNRSSPYEEYEQPVTSPWSQSPAPSPAPRPDPSENPFFAQPQVDEGTFNPASHTPVYSAQEPVNAIGCESSWTVIHIPLVHPSLSKSLRPSNSMTEASNFYSSSGLGSMDDIARQQKKSPIAILSMLSPVIPYPSNLIHSLSHFAPLVATAFSLAQTHTNVLNQLNHFRSKRPSKQRPTFGRATSYMSTLSLQSPDLVTDSLTSPSESSSAFTGSGLTSPAWDQMSGSTPGRQTATTESSNYHSASSQAGTPASPGNCDPSDGYFTRLGRKGIFSRQMSGNVQSVNNMLPKGADPETYTSLEARLRMRQDEVQRHTSNNRGRGSYFPETGVAPMEPPQRDADKTPTQLNSATADPRVVIRDRSPKRTRPRAKRRGVGVKSAHTFLHSYGADYASTFQSLSGGSTSSKRNYGSSTASRISQPPSLSVHEMPPPSNKLLRTIIDSIPVHVFTAAPDTGRMTWVNARMLAYRGLSPEQFMNQPWEALHPEERDEYRRRWAIAIRKGEPFSHQVRVRRFDGMQRWFMVRAVPLRDQRGIIVHWFGTNMDIHEQRLAELNATKQAEKAQSESKYRSLANSSPQIVFAATANQGITFANTQWAGYSGQEQEQSLKLGFMEYVHPADRHKCCLPGIGTAYKGIGGSSGSCSSVESESEGTDDKACRKDRRRSKAKSVMKSEKDGPTYSTELRLRDKHGNYRWHLVRCVCVEQNISDGQAMWFGTCTDINDHKLLEQKLKEANEAAQKTMDSKTRFLANMSHEIRTPLIGISGMVTFLLDTPLNGEQLDYCHTISQSSDGLLSVINDILDLSKVEAGMMRLNPEWYRINTLIEDAHELLSTMAIAKDLELNFIVEEHVPPVVFGDRVRLRQVLLNVIGNAIKFTNKGEVFSRCSVMKRDDLKDDEVMLQFECHDTGPGFDAKDEEFMFKPFSQIDGSSTRAHGGSGLGLVISRQLVELHGGSLNATSEKGKGSTFIASAKFRVPRPTLPESVSSSPTTALLGANPAGQLRASLPLKEHILEADRFMDSPPSLTYTDETPSTVSSASTNPSFRSVPSSDPSAQSPTSSLHHISLYTSRSDPGSMRLALPEEAQKKYEEHSEEATSDESTSTKKPAHPKGDEGKDLGKTVIPPMFSILIASDQPYSRLAISHHIRVTLPKNIPNQITTVGEFPEIMRLIGGEDPVVFTHIVISLPDYQEIISLISQVQKNPIHSHTTVLVLTNPTQRTAIIQNATDMYETMGARLQFIYKPIKPSRFGDIFDPAKERDASMDRNRDSAQQVVETQKKVFTGLEHEVGNKGHIVLLVEDNPVNQKVLLKFLAKVGLGVETASDGEECVQKVFSEPPGHYGLILCDLHMPRKDGFQATSEIREWERKNNAPPVPIVALSANVMSDVADKCILAGFSRYVTKPVDFQELSNTIKELLPNAHHEMPEESDKEDKEIKRAKERDQNIANAKLAAIKGSPGKEGSEWGRGRLR
ncbi:hypothetical protein EDC01DRAFT_628988 [Geopyxis carbonaria]|nr:hypothetical protein EDC01DRAFT_628988 [Geopyxis carbonaria]